MDNSFKKQVNKNFDHWKFTQDGKFDKCNRKFKQMRRKHQRAIEKRNLKEIVDKYR